MEDSDESWTSTVINEQLRKRLGTNQSAKVTNLASQPCIAVNMPTGKDLTFDGDAGDNLAGLNNGSRIVLNGNAGRFVGNGMIKGEIIINGNCGEGTGHSLSGGTLVVQGSVEGNAGPSMKGGDLIISGSVQGDTATCMSGGTIIVCGDVEGTIGKLMTGGKVFLGGKFVNNDNKSQSKPPKKKFFTCIKHKDTKMEKVKIYPKHVSGMKLTMVFKECTMGVKN